MVHDRNGLTRRALLAAPTGLVASAATFGRAHGLAAPVGRAAGGAPGMERDDEGLIETAVHGGAGRLKVKFFGFGGAPSPNLFLTYVIPPGCSEGVHVHRLGDRALGSYDEYYYVLEGAGVMEIEGRRFAVSAGDHAHAPLGASHGIANPDGPGDLKLFLTAVERG